MTYAITWNKNVRLVLADVDETIADVYTPAESEMIAELSYYLQTGGKLFMVTGGSLKRVREDIVNYIDPILRRDILISHCSGAEVWGFDSAGKLNDRPFYSLYNEAFPEAIKKKWREAVWQLIDEFGLRPHPVQAKAKFWKSIGRDPRDIMLDDRGPQITLEVVNGTDLREEQCNLFTQTIPLLRGSRRDLRLVLMERITEILADKSVPVTPRLGGMYALDLAIENSSKKTSIRRVFDDPNVLASLNMTQSDLQNPAYLEVWGDKFSIPQGGTDRHMSEALPKDVRSIDFREEDKDELPDGYNIVLWNGKKHLHNGLLEYLQSRPKQ